MNQSSDATGREIFFSFCEIRNLEKTYLLISLSQYLSLSLNVNRALISSVAAGVLYIIITALRGPTLGL